ncbi:MAG: hypothetical protein H8E12_16895 [Rhodobacteraceae bacterium]|nr:hypothetical protein [Paracoccaceae bacterium]
MDKILEYHYGDHNSEVFTLVHSEHLNKVADYAEDVQEFIKFLERKAGKTYALVNAMSAGEYYGSNRNGDYFPKKALQAYHKTFESNGHVYKHHVNKDPKKALGRIAFSHYNPSMNRVELVLELDNARSAKIVEKLNDGHLPAVSMGCRVPYDECSVCGNRAKTLREYCDHLKGKMNKVLEDGRKVFAINSMPKFFDLSIVTIPADRTAGFLAKLASSEPVISSAQLAEQLDKEGELEANADIKKKIELPLNIDSLSKDPKNLIRDSQAPLDTKTIEKLSEMNLDEVMSTFLGLRIMPSRRDFQKLALYSIGQSKLAEDLDAQDLIFNASDEKVLDFSSIKYDNFNEKIAGLLENSIPYMSLTQPLIVSRVLEKVAGTG